MDLQKIQQLIGIPSPDIQSDVDRKITETLDKLQLSEIRRPVVKYDLKGHTAGMAVNGSVIRLNLELLYDDRFYDDMIKNTLPHEVAHIVVMQKWPRSRAHGYEWASVMHSLGLAATRCHNYDTKPARVRERPYRYQCACKIHKITKTLHDRMQRGRSYTCRTCGGRLVLVEGSEIT